MVQQICLVVLLKDTKYVEEAHTAEKAKASSNDCETCSEADLSYVSGTQEDLR